MTHCKTKFQRNREKLCNLGSNILFLAKIVCPFVLAISKRKLSSFLDHLLLLVEVVNLLPRWSATKLMEMNKINLRILPETIVPHFRKSYSFFRTVWKLPSPMIGNSSSIPHYSSPTYSSSILLLH